MRNEKILDQPVTVDINDSQISQIRWNQDKKTFEGKITWTVQKGNNTVIQLDEAWVGTNLQEKSIVHCKQMSQKSKKFYKIPPGNPSTQIIPRNLLNLTLPVIFFRQSETDVSCLMLSFANALHFRNYQKEALEFKRVSETEINLQVSKFQLFHSTFSSQFPRSELKSISDKDYTVLFDNSDNFKVITLLSTDGDGMHAVTIWKKIIFDSSLERALPLSLKALDFICGEGHYFKGIHKGYLVEIKTDYFQKKNKRRRQRNDAKRLVKVERESDDEEKATKRPKTTNPPLSESLPAKMQMKQSENDDTESDVDLGIL